MSAGRFTRLGYTRDNGDVHPIRVQPETVQATFAPGGANAGVAVGQLTSDIECRARGSARSFGLRARFVTISWDVRPDDYEGDTSTIPILSPTVFAAITQGASVDYLGGAGTVLSKSPESPFTG